MVNLWEIPAPVKKLFDIFPLKIYGPVKLTDNAMDHEINERTYFFQSEKIVKSSQDQVFKLGVYNVIQDPTTDNILATDPWCLFAQLSLCKKNSLKLCKKPPKYQQVQHSICLLSSHSSLNERLPILIEGNSRRYIRSTENINEILKSKITDSAEMMYISLLDTVVYDCFLTQVLYHISKETFMHLYCYQTNRSVHLNTLLIGDIKAKLVKRNEFNLRHPRIVENIENMVFYNSKNVDTLTTPLLDKCQTILLQFQELLGEKAFYSLNNSPDYLDLKITSYIMSIIMLGEESPLNRFINEYCLLLISHSQRVLLEYN